MDLVVKTRELSRFKSSYVAELVFSMYKTMGTPRSLRLWMLYRSGDYKGLVETDLPNPTHYSWDTQGGYEFWRDYQSTKFLRSAAFLKTGIDLEAVALRKLDESEASCRSTNERILKALAGLGDPRLLSLIWSARWKIQRVLGSFCLDEFHEGLGWGPGATASLPRKRATVTDKLLEPQLSVTSGAYQLARLVVGRDLHWLRARGIPADGPCSLLEKEFSLVEGCKGITVPKDAKGDRFIAIEPTMNLFLQKGIGKMIRKRLKESCGIDLRSQRRNQRLAKFGSKTGLLATLDLSAASDSVSRQLVSALVPDDWFVWLNRTRSPYLLDQKSGKYRWLEKFSSMGNGFTFELETLLFWAIAASAEEVYPDLLSEDPKQRAPFRPVCYGDDIVCGVDSAHSVIASLELAGFKINRDKSFIDGPFRESCGEHYWLGASVKPVYLTDDPCGSPEGFFASHNKLAVASQRGFIELNAVKDVALRYWNGRYVTPLAGDDTDLTGISLPFDQLIDWALPCRDRSPTRVPRSYEEAARPSYDGWDGFLVKGLVRDNEEKESVWHEPLLAYTLRFQPLEPLAGVLQTLKRTTYSVKSRFVRYSFDTP